MYVYVIHPSAAPDASTINLAFQSQSPANIPTSSANVLLLDAWYIYNYIYQAVYSLALHMYMYMCTNIHFSHNACCYYLPTALLLAYCTCTCTYL